MSVGYLAGLFDLVNVRDLDLINQARAGCARLVLGVFTDEYAETASGRRPVVPLEERMTLLRHVRGVAAVVPDDGSAGGHSTVPDVWFVAGDRPAGYPRDAVRLRSHRQSASPILRRVLHPAATAVA